ncbi:putative ribonuclease H-like domain-containing protein, partial [Tanacetum coccineum]
MVKPVWNNAQRVNHQNFAKKTHPYAKKNLVPRAVLMKSGLVSVNTARQVNTAHSKTTVNAARPMSYLSKTAHSTIKRPIHKNTAFKNSNINQRVNTARDKKFNTARPKAVVNAVKGNNFNVVKASACWVWKPKHKVLDHGNLQMDLQDQGVIDSGCSRHMTGNMSYLTNYEEIDGVYVNFGGTPKEENHRKVPLKLVTQSNGFEVQKQTDNAVKLKGTKPDKDYILLPLWTADPPYSQDPKSSHDDGSKPSSDDGKKVDEDPRKDSECNDQEKEDTVNSTNTVNALTQMKLMLDDEDDDAEAYMNNLDTTIQVSPIPTTRIHKDHPLDQVIEDLQSATQTRKCQKNLKEHGVKKPKRVIHALKDPSWIEAMQEELLQFKNKKDERGIVIRNKARLVAQGYTQDEVIDYDKVFAHVVRIKAIRLFLAYASFKYFVVYQMDVKSAFLYGKIEEEVYVCQPPRFEDPNFPDRVYKVEKALYGLHQAPRAWYETLSTYLLDNGFQRGKIDKTLFIKRHKGDILLVQVYVDDIIFGSTKKELCNAFKKLMHDKFLMSLWENLHSSWDYKFTEVKTASTPIETQKPLLKDEDGEEVDVHMYRSMIGSLMYLTSSRPDIMFAVCACARYQVNPKVSHLHAVKRIFSDYAGASLDRKSIIRGCQFFRCRLISWQYKKQTVVANSTTEAEYVAASNTHNMVAFLSKPEESDGFEQIVDFLNAHLIKYALTVNPTIYTSCIEQFWSAVKAKTINGEVQLHALVDDEVVHKELGNRLVRAATTASSLEAEQDNGNITKTRSKATPNESSSLGTTSGGGPRGNTLQSDEDSLKLKELMEL